VEGRLQPKVDACGQRGRGGVEAIMTSTLKNRRNFLLVILLQIFMLYYLMYSVKLCVFILFFY